MRAKAYPAGNSMVGRRAREVMPAAMRALVRIADWPTDAFIDLDGLGMGAR
ncbi:MAG: hypothetical protein M0Q70_05675 [Dokdonella sp.]|nr:hypothetical protein [Dokdonella sp.]